MWHSTRQWNIAMSSLDHGHYLRLALAEARKSPPKPTNFCIGAVLVSSSSTASPTNHSDPRVLVTGYTLECPGNTHAEQSCFIKLASAWKIFYDVPSAKPEILGYRLPEDTVLYTTMEPCNKRSPGNATCVERIIGLKRQDGRQSVKTVVVGVLEPETFVSVNKGRRKLEEADIEVVHAPGMEKEILAVATAGHKREDG